MWGLVDAYGECGGVKGGGRVVGCEMGLDTEWLLGCQSRSRLTRERRCVKSIPG